MLAMNLAGGVPLPMALQGLNPGEQETEHGFLARTGEDLVDWRAVFSASWTSASESVVGIIVRCARAAATVSARSYSAPPRRS